MTFDEWKNKVNAEVQNLIGLSADDLPDFTYRDAFEAGESPESVAQQVVDKELELFDLYRGLF